MTYIISHWAVFSGIGVAVISEVMPLLPNKYNGILHTVVEILKPKNAPQP